MSILAALIIGGCTCDPGGVSELIPQIESAPQALDLGQIPLGVRAQGAVTIRSTGEIALEIQTVRLEGPSMFEMVAAPAHALAPNTSDVALVAATPHELGRADATLVIESDDPESPVVRVAVTIEGVPVPPCDDGNGCTADVYNTETRGCEHSFADGISCSSADKCIVNATCSQGVCLGQGKTCDDSNMCTRDYCRQTDGECVFAPDITPCNDHNPCTVDACEPSGCLHENLPSGNPCDDNDLCTTGDSCFAGECRGNGLPDGSSCDDGDSCTIGDTCSSGHCTGQSTVADKAEGTVLFNYPLESWPGGFLHRREVSLSEDGIFIGLDHLPLTNPDGLAHVAFAMKQCGSPAYEFSYRPPDSHVLVRYVRREMQLETDGSLRLVVGVRQLPDDGYRPETTTYVLAPDGTVKSSSIESLGGETGRALLHDGSHIYGVIWPVSSGPPTPDMPSMQNLVVVREDRNGHVLWRHERASWDWSEFLGVAGPRVLFWASGRFGALDFNTGNLVWSSPTQLITKEMALSTSLNLGVARASTQLLGVEILQGRPVFMFPPSEDPSYIPRTDPVISADGRVLVLMQRNSPDLVTALGLEWVELDATGQVRSATPLDYVFPDDFSLTRHEDDPYPTVADDGVAYVGYGDHFWAINPGGQVRWTLTATTPNAYTGTVPVLRDDGVLLISEGHRRIKGIRSNGGRMSDSGWASFRHDARRTNFTP